MGNMCSAQHQKQEPINKLANKKIKLYQKFNPERVFDQDYRQIIPQNSTLKFIGLIRSKFSFSHTNKIGTGIVIAPKIVLTVAHNITQINHKTGNLEEAEWIEFYPGNNGKVQGFTAQGFHKPNEQRGTYRVLKTQIPGNYKKDRNPQFDFALMLLDKQVCLKQNIKIFSNDFDMNSKISLVGYPLNYKQNNIVDFSFYQYGHQGTIIEKDNVFLKYKISASEGQSGSPIFIQSDDNTIYCIGIHKGAIERYEINIGIKITNSVFQEICRMEERLTNTAISQFIRLKLPSLPQTVKIKVNYKSIQYSLSDLQSKIGQLQPHISTVPSNKLLGLYYKAANTAYSQFEYQIAICYYEKLVDWHDKMPIEDDQQNQYQTILFNLAKCHSQMNHQKQTTQLLQKINQIFQKRYSQDHQKMTFFYNNKAADLQSMGKHQQAHALFQKTYQIRTRLFGVDHELTLAAYENMIAVQIHLGSDYHASCMTKIQKIIQKKSKIYGSTSEEVCCSKMNLAVLSFCSKQYQKAISQIYECIGTMNKIIALEKRQKNISYKRMRNNFCTFVKEILKSQSSLQELELTMQAAQQIGQLNLTKKIQEELQLRKNQAKRI